MIFDTPHSPKSSYQAVACLIGHVVPTLQPADSRISPYSIEIHRSRLAREWRYSPYHAPSISGVSGTHQLLQGSCLMVLSSKCQASRSARQGRPRDRFARRGQHFSSTLHKAVLHLLCVSGRLLRSYRNGKYARALDPSQYQASQSSPTKGQSRPRILLDVGYAWRNVL